MATHNYLSKEGLLYLVAKLKALFATKDSLPKKVSDLTNDSDFQSGTQVSNAIASAIGDIETIKFEIVTQLPTTGSASTVYLLANDGGSYDEYIYVNATWEKIGTTDVDLSGYVRSSDLVAISNAEIDGIMAS